MDGRLARAFTALIAERYRGGRQCIGMLPHLERSEVETERLDLPAEVLQLTPHDPAEAVVDERLGQLGELRFEIGRGSIPARPLLQILGQPKPGSAQPFRDRAQPLTVRRVW